MGSSFSSSRHRSATASYAATRSLPPLSAKQFPRSPSEASRSSSSSDQSTFSSDAPLPESRAPVRPRPRAVAVLHDRRSQTPPPPRRASGCVGVGVSAVSSGASDVSNFSRISHVSRISRRSLVDRVSSTAPVTPTDTATPSGTPSAWNQRMGPYFAPGSSNAPRSRSKRASANNASGGHKRQASPLLLKQLTSISMSWEPPREGSDAWLFKNACGVTLGSVASVLVNSKRCAALWDAVLGEIVATDRLKDMVRLLTEAVHVTRETKETQEMRRLVPADPREIHECVTHVVFAVRSHFQWMGRFRVTREDFVLFIPALLWDVENQASLL